MISLKRQPVVIWLRIGSSGSSGQQMGQQRANSKSNFSSWLIIVAAERKSADF